MLFFDVEDVRRDFLSLNGFFSRARKPATETASTRLIYPFRDPKNIRREPADATLQLLRRCLLFPRLLLPSTRLLLSPLEPVLALHLRIAGLVQLSFQRGDLLRLVQYLVQRP